MQITQTRKEMLAVTTELRQRLAAERDDCKAIALIDRTRKRIEQIRKRFKRRIDERARFKPGDAWFSINSREGIEKMLAKVTQEAHDAIESALLEHCRKSQQGNISTIAKIEPKHR
jgi:hypothetical protein